MIELRGDVEFKDTLVVDIPKLEGEKRVEVPRQEVSNSKPFDVLNSVENDVELGKNGGISKSTDKGTINGSSSNNPVVKKINTIERQIRRGKHRFVDDDGNPLIPPGIVDSHSEVEVIFDETANLRLSTSFNDRSDKEEENLSINRTMTTRPSEKQRTKRKEKKIVGVSSAAILITSEVIVPNTPTMTKRLMLEDVGVIVVKMMIPRRTRHVSWLMTLMRYFLTLLIIVVP
ncbi:hypothetical protein Tco_1423721 [Tanacetum coccineum]